MAQLEALLHAKQRELLRVRLAVGFAVVLAVVEAIANWRSPSWWPFILVSYVAVALLIVGAVWSRRVLAAGWGFACAMLYMTFFSTWQRGGGWLILLGTGALFAVAIFGLVLSLLPGAPEREPVG
jgi:hypothetical protein